MANETWKFVQAKSEEQAGNEAGTCTHTRDQRREDAHDGDAAAGGGTPAFMQPPS